jgi:hypothetical protein
LAAAQKKAAQKKAAQKKAALRSLEEEANGVAWE